MKFIFMLNSSLQVKYFLLHIIINMQFYYEGIWFLFLHNILILRSSYKIFSLLRILQEILDFSQTFLLLYQYILFKTTLYIGSYSFNIKWFLPRSSLRLNIVQILPNIS